MKAILIYFIFNTFIFFGMESKGINGFTDSNDPVEMITTPVMPAVELECNIDLLVSCESSGKNQYVKYYNIYNKFFKTFVIIRTKAQKLK